MSHFSVLVITPSFPSNDDLTKIMMPYHEFECTGCDNEYVKDIDITEEVIETYENNTSLKLKDPDGNYYSAYDDRFYISKIGSSSRILYDEKMRVIPVGWEEVSMPTKNFQTIIEFIEDYYGYKIRTEYNSEDTKFGYILTDENNNFLKCIKHTNPSPQWDWYQIGGRYSGKFSHIDPTKDPRNFETCWICSGTGMRIDEIGQEARLANPEYKCNGCNGTGNMQKWPTQWVSDGNKIMVGDINWEYMKEKAINDRKEWIEEIQKRAKCTYEEVKIALELNPYISQEWEKLEEPRPRGVNYYPHFENRGDNYAIWAKVIRAIWERPKLNIGQTLEEWIESAPALTTYAFIKDGVWYQKGEMGWWGISSNEMSDEEWQQQVQDMLNSCNKTDWITVVDCHI